MRLSALFESSPAKRWFTAFEEFMATLDDTLKGIVYGNDAMNYVLGLQKLIEFVEQSPRYRRYATQIVDRANDLIDLAGVSADFEDDGKP